MKIIITGATGYLGSHLSRTLINSGYELIATIRENSKLDLLKDLKKKITFYNVQQFSLQKIFEDNKNIEGIVHTATCYGRKNECLYDIHYSNNIFPLALLEKAIQNKCKFFLNTDTSLKKYTNQYSLSKKHFFESSKEITKKKDIKFINVFLEHFFGPNEDQSKFISYLIDKFLANEKEIKLTEGEQIRDFIYIDDVIDAYEQIIRNYMKFNNGFNEIDIGSGEGIKIKDLVYLISKLTKTKTKLLFGEINYRENESMLSISNINLIKSLGWVKKTSLEEGLKKVISIKKCL